MGYQIELITFEIAAAERLQLMRFDNRLIIDFFANVVNILGYGYFLQMIDSEVRNMNPITFYFILPFLFLLVLKYGLIFILHLINAALIVFLQEHITCDILAAERLQLMRFDNQLIIDSFQKAIYILKW